MTVKQLKAIISDLPDDMEIGGIGHYGEFLECFSIMVGTAREGMHKPSKKQILCISIDDPGEEPS